MCNGEARAVAGIVERDLSQLVANANKARQQVEELLAFTHVAHQCLQTLRQ